MNFFMELFSSKMMLMSVGAIVLFIVIAILLIKKVMSEKDEDENVKIDIQKIDGENSVFDEIIEEKEKSGSNQLDLDSMIAKMQKDLDAKASDVVEKFENEQEEKSIISYKELQKQKEQKENVAIIEEKDNEVNQKLDLLSEEISKIENNEVTSLVEETKEEPLFEEKQELEPISILEEEPKISDFNVRGALNKLQALEDDLNSDEDIQMVNISEIPDEDIITSKLNKKDEFVEAIKTGNYDDKEEKTTKFKATEFISPIYGIQDIKIQYPTVQNMKDFKENYNKYNKFEVDNTLNINKVNNEIHQDEDFLNTLKEFRKNLE